MSDRKYALTKIGTGDWLLPSNDGRILWRIRLYDEEIPVGDDAFETRERWGVWKWLGHIAPGAVPDPMEPEEWDFFEGFHETRREAIDAALKLKGTES